MAADGERCFGPLAQVPVGEGRVFGLPAADLDGEGGGSPCEVTVAVFHLRSGAVHATQAACPHRGGPLADGILGGTTLICPLHGRRYDVSTGAALSDGGGLVTYPARVSGDGEIVVATHPAVAGDGASVGSSASA